jgi:methanogenic corrinoid protein MtbC1
LNSDTTTAIERVTSAILSVNYLYLKLAYETSGIEADRFAEEVLVPALDTIGERWEHGDLSLAQVYMSGRMCERLLDENGGVRPEAERDHAMAVAILEDFHVLGKRIVCSVLHAVGYRFKDYGPISLDDLVEKVISDKIRILLVSTLMLSSALRVKLLRERLAALDWHVSIIVGGAPFRFDPNLWREVGADATSNTASGVAAVLHRIISEAPHDYA